MFYPTYVLFAQMRNIRYKFLLDLFKNMLHETFFLQNTPMFSSHIPKLVSFSSILSQIKHYTKLNGIPREKYFDIH